MRSIHELLEAKLFRLFTKILVFLHLFLNQNLICFDQKLKEICFKSRLKLVSFLGHYFSLKSYAGTITLNAAI